MSWLVPGSVKPRETAIKIASITTFTIKNPLKNFAAKY